MCNNASKCSRLWNEHVNQLQSETLGCSPFEVFGVTGVAERVVWTPKKSLLLFFCCGGTFSGHKEDTNCSVRNENYSQKVGADLVLKSGISADFASMLGGTRSKTKRLMTSKQDKPSTGTRTKLPTRHVQETLKSITSPVDPVRFQCRARAATGTYTRCGEEGREGASPGHREARSPLFPWNLYVFRFFRGTVLSRLCFGGVQGGEIQDETSPAHPVSWSRCWKFQVLSEACFRGSVV